jgi:HlyD family secretion protein
MLKKIIKNWVFQGAGVVLSLVLLVSCQNDKNKATISASGTIEAIEVTVSAKTTGQVVRLLVDEGSQVKNGDKLAVIDSSSLEIQVQQAQAGVNLAEAQLQLLVKGARIEDIKQAQEALTQAEANLKIAQADRDRFRDLFAKNSATAKQNQDAEARYIVARAQHDAAQQALLKLEKYARPEEIKAAEARLDQAMAARDLLQKTIADSTISAPVPGIVTDKATEEGEFVGPGTALVTIASLSEVHLNIYIPETDLGKVRLGQEAEVTIDSYPDRAFTGRVIFISPEAEFTPKNVQTKEERVKLVFRVKIEIPNPDNILKPGMPADALIRLNAAVSNPKEG